MMHRCCNSQGNIVGPCSCGLFHSQNNSSVLFPMPSHKSYDETDMYNSFTSYSSSSVDCTLSLGTPSTRLCEDDDRRSRHDRRAGNSCTSNFCWDLLQNKNTHGCSQQTTKASRGSNGNSGSSSGNDPLLARRCANCDTTSTPLWRNGPRGPKVFNHFAMPVEFDSKRKKGEHQQQMQTLQWRSSNITGTTTTAATIHGLQCTVSHRPSMKSSSSKMAIPIFLGDSTSLICQQDLFMTLQDEKEEQERKETHHAIDGQDHAAIAETYYNDDGDFVLPR
ncbi:hypothetical protein F3Y22_tig00110387pilonHSYRG00855 [Hibiscus syriacus]|uniref:GATA-type domain-containing protein n=1 Tax=Hibiscus syriacus TaxID=106335 RepID=A0A6A3AT66_HIBSY|nr:hypothetical protein F3Y22_tig00110387pilonHSYRG00855 [Hibiscus syriacus]